MGMIRTSSPWSDREEDIRRRLRSYRALVSKHAACQTLYETLFPRMTQRFSDEPRAGQIEMFEIESVVRQRMDLADIMEASLQSMRDELGSIMAMIKVLPADECTVLIRRYMMAESWEEIAKELNYCISHLHRIHDKGIVHIVKHERL